MRVCCVTGSKSPTLEDLEKDLVIADCARNELNEHEKKIKREFGVKDPDYLQKLREVLHYYYCQNTLIDISEEETGKK